MRSLNALMDLRGRVAVVTGGGGHIGSAIGEALSELGAAIVVVDIEQESCVKIAASIRESHAVETLPLVVDLSDEQAVKSIPQRTHARFGRLDILVNCAALVGATPLQGWMVPFPEQRADTWRRALEVNLTAPFVLTQACAGLLAESGHGAVVNVGSTYGLVGPDLRLYEGTSLGNPAAYAASKGGLLQLTRWLSTVLAPKVRVNAVTPGGVWRDQPATFVERYVTRTPLGRLATEEDLTGAVAYLASDLSAYVTGHNLVVDGGWTVW